jgi:WhiB family transcriptional regulator, redox-sensing transcriptional regulator
MELLATLNVELNLDVLEWATRGECNKYDPNLHYPEGERTQKAQDKIRQAKAVCAVCPIIAECRVRGMNEVFGIWGGLTESERRPFQKNARLTAREKVSA